MTRMKCNRVFGFATHFSTGRFHPYARLAQICSNSFFHTICHNLCMWRHEHDAHNGKWHGYLRLPRIGYRKERKGGETGKPTTYEYISLETMLGDMNNMCYWRFNCLLRQCCYTSNGHSRDWSGRLNGEYEWKYTELYAYSVTIAMAYEWEESIYLSPLFSSLFAVRCVHLRLHISAMRRQFRIHLSTT